MYTYLKYDVRGKYVEFPEQLSPELYDNIGSTWMDYINGLWVPLSDEQMAFKEANPNASIREVFEMKVNEPIVYVRTAEDAKREMTDKINRYDSSSSVNIFYIQGLEVWLDKATRTGLKLRFEAEMAMGQTETTLWYNNMQFPLTVENAIKMLYAIELYASACYDRTQAHLAAVNALEDVETIDTYDYKAGYPEKLNF